MNNIQTRGTKLLQKYLSLALILFLFSCDCNQNVSGNIFDEKTKMPLKNVEVQNRYKDWCNVKTDTAGYFTLSATSGGFFSCSPMEIIIAKQGYFMKVIKIENSKHEKIYLKKKEKWQ